MLRDEIQSLKKDAGVAKEGEAEHRRSITCSLERKHRDSRNNLQKELKELDTELLGGSCCPFCQSSCPFRSIHLLPTEI